MPVLLPVALAARGPARIRPDLERLRAALAQLGEPQRGLRSILVVGTNGKGSTAASLASLLSAHGPRIGLYTSPHLVRVEERIRVAGRPIGAADLDRQLDRLDRFPELTFFEALTAAALLHFAECGVELAVLEAGMGGRWDATRVAGSEVAGLTNVGSDHRDWLGDSPAAIAADKGAALAAATVAVHGSDLATELVTALGAPAAVPATDRARVDRQADGHLLLRWPGGETVVPSPLAGAHQRANLELAMALATAAVDLGWLPRLEPAAVARGLAAVQWPGRLTRHRVAGRTVLLDGAHNREGAAALAAHLATFDEPPNLLFSCLADKPLDAMAAALRPHVGRIAVCALDDERAMPAARLAAAFPGAVVATDPMSGLAALPDPVLAAGSLRLVGALLAEAE